MTFMFSNPIRRMLAASRRSENGIDGMAQNLHEAPSRVNAAPNIFWRNTRTEKHRPDPVADPLNTDPPRPPAPDVRRKCVCEFCECKLTPQGEIIEMGEKAKRFRNHDNVLEGKDREITRLNTEIAALRTENEQLKGSGRSSGHRPGAKVTS